MTDYFYSLQALLAPETIDMPEEVSRFCYCVVCRLADEENQ